jgi:VCBS repeat-containing protein
MRRSAGPSRSLRLAAHGLEKVAKSTASNAQVAIQQLGAGQSLTDSLTETSLRNS